VALLGFLVWRALRRQGPPPLMPVAERETSGVS